jgi:hypothetical protein
VAVVVAAVSLTACENISTLGRAAEPVVLTGEALPNMANVAPEDVVAFRYNGFDVGWQQIPVQVDERHQVDLRTVGNGYSPYSLSALEYSDPGTLTGADPNPDVDRDDEIVFMARDAFGRAPAGEPDPRGVKPGSGFEVRVTDPLDADAAGWVYLFVQQGSLDPAAGRDYVDYDFDLLAGEYPEDYDFDGGPGDPIGDPPENPAPPANPENSRVTTPFYSEHFLDRWITDQLQIRAGGATGADILDRNRVGVQFVNDTLNPCPRQENTFAAGHGAFVSNIDGPVRAIRDYIGANSGIYTQRRQVFYDRREDLTTFLRVHPLPVGSQEGGFGDVLDYTAGATGMTYRNSLMNPSSPAVAIDGNPDSVPTGILSWELAQGKQGSLVAAHSLDTDIPDLELGSIYLDDLTPDPLPCTGDAEARGISGPTILSDLPRTDPTPRGGTGPLYRLTSHRTHFYDAPGVTSDVAQRRGAEAGAPLQTVVSAR